MSLINYLILVVCVLLSVAFLTLFERKILGYIQIRKGPNKVGFLGLAQPFSDAIKLFSKEQVKPIMSNFYLYYFSPVFSLLISLILWFSFPFVFMIIDFEFSMLYIVGISGMGVYGIMMAGWASNSIYSLLGGIRSIAQTISYEVSMIMLMLSMLVFISSFNIMDFFQYQIYCWFIFLMFPLGLMIFTVFLAETNRTPFDLSEGESELVSGFNIEYSSGGFAMIFLAEYSSIIFMSFIFCMMFMGGNFYSLGFYFKIIFLSFMWIWVRGSLPRVRYDKLMDLTWTVFLPLSLLFLMVYFNLWMFLNIMNF
uniref:NADH-ubiquinone oxidoreductase chain 1 n=1 Tax=Downesia tarsata TaxID=2790390 RepID=A0A7T1C5D7_9CUCU|nr:NADH dehydrogenase subunit 1 [Downesia tarsata]QPM99437.1 NADH dehydrogenase subunit 1 [Downesia tarsata]